MMDDDGEAYLQDDSFTDFGNASSISLNRSGHARVQQTYIDTAIQTDDVQVDRPKLRIKKRASTSQIKSTCAQLSSVCGISVETSRKTVQIVGRCLYSHQFYLSAEEQIENEGVEMKTSTYDDHSYVIPLARTILEWKLLQASEIEKDAATALLNKKPEVKAIMHFDSTGRSSIDGEWPSIILRFSDGNEYRLRPIFFAYEDRQQITNLFVETLTRMVSTLHISLENDSIQASVLWEKIDALMTDAVTKNLEIEETIAKALDSDHIPFHLLCKSHTVEALDKSSLDVLARVEKSVKQQEILEKINPALRSFFRDKKAIAEAGIEALLSLFTLDKSAKSCSQADLFEFICEREGVSKRVFLYQQRRFAKLGKAASSILQARDIMQMVVDEVEGTNQLVEACRIYLASELFITELECLSYFNHHVTFPFLNCVETSSQADLLMLLPKLHDDLLEKNTETLKNFIVSTHRLPIPTLSSEVSKKITDMMCISAAAAVKLQCGREYGFSTGKELRATDLSSLAPEQLVGLPTNNLVAERDLSKFDREARVAKSRNRRFRAKNIRNNMMLYQTTKELKITKMSHKIASILSNREETWTANQKERFQQRLQEKLIKCRKAKDYTKKLLNSCKSWGGPCTSVDELHEILREKAHEQELIVKTEHSYYVHTHKLDKTARPALCKINGITHEEKLVNLAILLDDDTASQYTMDDVPTNLDVISALECTQHQRQWVNQAILGVNELRVVVWQNCDSKYEWFLAYIKHIEDDKCTVDHLHRATNSSDCKWKYPSIEDVQEAELDQLLNCSVEGHWYIAPDKRKRLFSVSNITAIDAAFKRHINF